MNWSRSFTPQLLVGGGFQRMLPLMLEDLLAAYVLHALRQEFICNWEGAMG